MSTASTAYVILALISLVFLLIIAEKITADLLGFKKGNLRLICFISAISWIPHWLGTIFWINSAKVSFYHKCGSSENPSHEHCARIGWKIALLNVFLMLFNALFCFWIFRRNHISKIDYPIFTNTIAGIRTKSLLKYVILSIVLCFFLIIVSIFHSNWVKTSSPQEIQGDIWRWVDWSDGSYPWDCHAAIETCGNEEDPQPWEIFSNLSSASETLIFLAPISCIFLFLWLHSALYLVQHINYGIPMLNYLYLFWAAGTYIGGVAVWYTTSNAKIFSCESGELWSELGPILSLVSCVILAVMAIVFAVVYNNRTKGMEHYRLVS